MEKNLFQSLLHFAISIEVLSYSHLVSTTLKVKYSIVDDWILIDFQLRFNPNYVWHSHKATKIQSDTTCSKQKELGVKLMIYP